MLKKISIVVATFLLSVIIGMSAMASPGAHGTYHLVVEDGCTGEFVVGDVNVNIHASVLFTGKTLHLSLHANYNGSATGTDSGNKYILVAVQNEEENIKVNPDTLTGEFTFTLKENFISQGSNPNELIQIVQHLTVNANGTVTVNSIKFTVECAP